MKAPSVFLCALLFITSTVLADEVELPVYRENSFLGCTEPSAPSSDPVAGLSLVELLENEYWLAYLSTCIELYLASDGVTLHAEVHESYLPYYTYFARPEIQTLDFDLFRVWLEQNFPGDAADLLATFAYWRSNAYAPDETAWLGPAPENSDTDPLPGYTGENDGLGWFPEALSPSEPIAAPSAEPAKMETQDPMGVEPEASLDMPAPITEMENPPAAPVDPFAGLSLFELFENPEWLSYLAYCVDLYLIQAGTVLSADAYDGPYAFFGAPAVQALLPGEMAVWLYENFAMDAANLAVTFDGWRSRAAIPAIDPAANEQALDSSADVNNQPSQIALPAEAPCKCGTNATVALGRALDWINRDPLGKLGGTNLYAFVYTNALSWADILGRGPSQLDQANEQFNAALSDWASGKGGGRTFGPDDPWTKELAKLPVYSRMREWIKNAAREACANGSSNTLVNKRLLWDDEADDHPVTGPVRDIFNYVFETGLQSTGSTKGRFTITSLSCCPSEVCFDMTVTDVLRLGSATRIPGTDIPILPDIPSGIIPFTNIDLQIPFENYSLTWRWSECLGFSF